MTAQPARAWGHGADAAADRSTADDDVCVSCGVLFRWQDGWDGECLECAVLSQEHVCGGHGGVTIGACRRCG